MLITWSILALFIDVISHSDFVKNLFKLLWSFYPKQSLISCIVLLSEAINPLIRFLKCLYCFLLKFFLYQPSNLLICGGTSTRGKDIFNTSFFVFYHLNSRIGYHKPNNARMS